MITISHLCSSSGTLFRRCSVRFIGTTFHMKNFSICLVHLHSVSQHSSTWQEIVQIFCAYKHLPKFHYLVTQPLCLLPHPYNVYFILYIILLVVFLNFPCPLCPSRSCFTHKHRQSKYNVKYQYFSIRSKEPIHKGAKNVTAILFWIYT